MTGHNSSQLITLTVTDANMNTSLCQFTLTAADTIPATIDPMTCPGDQTISLNDTCYYIIPDYRGDITITDNCEAPIDLDGDPGPSTRHCTHQEMAPRS